MKSKIITISFILLIVLSAIAFAYAAGEPTVVAHGSCGDTAVYDLYSDGNFVVSGSGKVNAFLYGRDDIKAIKTSITAITIGRDITVIGQQAFFQYENLQSVTLEEGSKLESIDASAFHSCKKLESINLQCANELVEIGAYAFKYCTSIKSIVIPPGMTNLKQEICAYCDNLQSIIFKKGCNIQSFNNSAFFHSPKVVLCGFSDTIKNYANGASISYVDLADSEFSNLSTFFIIKDSKINSNVRTAFAAMYNENGKMTGVIEIVPGNGVACGVNPTSIKTDDVITLFLLGDENVPANETIGATVNIISLK